MTSLKNEIVGSWKLLSYIEIPVGGDDYQFPLGQKPKGILILSSDGFMSVQIAVNTSSRYENEDRFSVSDSDLAARAKQYIAFSGTYTIDSEYSRVTYNIITSLHPNWEGEKQVRKMDFEKDIMYQKSVDPVLSGGQFVHVYMTWQRVHKTEEIEAESEEFSRGFGFL